MPGPGFTVPSAVQSPVMKSSFFNSGAGVGGPICALSKVTAKKAKKTVHTASDVRFIEILLFRLFAGAQMVGQRVIVRQSRVDQYQVNQSSATA
jgi:hypothetical protein